MTSGRVNPTWGTRTEPRRLKLVLNKTQKDWKLLDYGCGKGAYVETLNRLGYRAQGADLFSFPEWEKIERKLGEEQGPLFKQVDGDLPFPDRSFDGVFAFEVLEHCPDLSGTLGELKRVGKNDFFFSVPDCDTTHELRRHSLAFAHWTDRTHVNFFTEESFCQALEAEGFAIQFQGRAFLIDLNRCFWQHLRLPSFLRRVGERCTRPLAPKYYSSILIHATRP